MAPDGTPYEAYTLTTDGAGTLTVMAGSGDFTPVIAVRSIDGLPLTLPSASPMNVVLSGDSQYLIIISSADTSAGAYQITTTYQTADAETCRSRKTFADSDSDNNAITGDSCFVTIAGSGDQSYYNYYNFTLSAAGVVSASAVSGDFTATLTLLDAAGNTLAFDSAGGGSDQQSNTISSLRAQLPAGSYRLRIASDLPSGGNYALKYAFQAGNPQPCAASALNFGDQLNRALTDASCRTSLGLSDLYTLTLPSSGTVDLELDSTSFDTVLAIRDSKDNLIVRDDEVNGLSVAHITADLPAGVYTLIGAATSGAGSYQLTAKFTAHDIPACSFAQSLDLNGGYHPTPWSAQLHRRQRPAGGLLYLHPVRRCVGARRHDLQRSGWLPDTLRFQRPCGAQRRQQLRLQRSLDRAVPPAGTYKLAARAASSTVGGLYQVDLRTVTGPRPPFATPKATMTPGETVSGVITYTGCQYIDNTFADLYQMNLSADCNNRSAAQL